MSIYGSDQHTSDESCIASSKKPRRKKGTPEVYVVVHLGCVSYVSSTKDVKVHVIDLDVPNHNEDGLLDVANSLPRYW